MEQANLVPISKLEVASIPRGGKERLRLSGLSMGLSAFVIPHSFFCMAWDSYTFLFIKIKGWTKFERKSNFGAAFSCSTIRILMSRRRKFRPQL